MLQVCVPLNGRYVPPFGLFIFLLQVVWHDVRARISDDEIRQYCQWETFNATCRPDEVAVMQSARYGRMRFGRCVREDHGHVGCSADVLGHLDQKCSGRHQCVMPIPDATLHQIHACPKELMSYLEAEYGCIKVETNKDQVCDKFQPIEISSSLGYLASVVADDTGFGMVNCPWLIRVTTGRNIKLTLYNFAFTVPGLAGSAGRSICETYLTIKENHRTKNITVCKGDTREREVYISETNAVHVNMLPARGSGAEDSRKFIVRYEAIGCPDLKPKDHSWVKRVGNTAIVKCNHTGETYFLTCEGADWVGDIGNCSRTSAWRRRNSGSSASRFPYGLLVVIGIGVALGVAVGIILLMSILLCVKRRKERNTRSATTDPLLEEVTHENDENHAQCNCQAKIYYSSRLELQRQLQRHAMEKAKRDSLATANTDNQLGTGCESLPMPDMCMIETVPINEILTDNRPPQPEDEQREMQTSFITFKPNTASTGTLNVQDACNACCTQASSNSVVGQGGVSIYDRRRREIQTGNAAYGTSGDRTRTLTVYDTATRKPCAECVKDKESIYSTRQRELLNANNLANDTNNIIVKMEKSDQTV